jgi:hypothetical protein
MHVSPKDRLLSDEPKCANCAHWSKLSAAFGECYDPASKIVVNEATVMHVVKPRYTTDLTVCSQWTHDNV